MTFIEERNDIMKNAPTEYSVYVLYSEKHNCYVRKTQYWETDKTTTDPTKARLYLKKGAATLSLRQSNSASRSFHDYGFSVYERKVSTAISKVMTPEDKDAKIKSLEAEIGRLKKSLEVLSRPPLNLEELNKILAPPFPPSMVCPSKFK